MKVKLEILDSVKKALGITGSYQDDALNVWISDVKSYLESAGVAEEIIDSEVSYGTIARGVADIWDLGSGRGKLSIYFYERAIQLALRGNEDV